MDKPNPGVLRHWDAKSSEIRDALEHAVVRSLREHRKSGRSVVIWDQEKDQIVILRADQIPIFDKH